MYLCIFIFYSDSLPVICEGFWLAVKLRAVNLYNCLFLYVFSSVFIAEMKEVNTFGVHQTSLDQDFGGFFKIQFS